MKKAIVNRKESVDTSDLPEVDFSRGVRGKHYRKYREAPVVIIQTKSSTKEAKNPAKK